MPPARGFPLSWKGPPPRRPPMWGKAQKGKASGLRRPRRRPPAFTPPGLQPLADRADDPPISNPVLDEFDEPIVVHRVEEPGDVGVEDEVDPLLGDPDRQRVQRMVLAAPRPKAVAEPQKVCFPDRVQHLDHRALDDLVLQRRDAD